MLALFYQSQQLAKLSHTFVSSHMPVFPSTCLPLSLPHSQFPPRFFAEVFPNSRLNQVTQLHSHADWTLSFWNLPNVCLYICIWEYVWNIISTLKRKLSKARVVLTVFTPVLLIARRVLGGMFHAQVESSCPKDLQNLKTNRHDPQTVFCSLKCFKLFCFSRFRLYFTENL